MGFDSGCGFAGGGSSGGGGSVTSITALAPLTGGVITTSGNIGIPQGTALASGYLLNTDWTTFNNKMNGLVPIGILTAATYSANPQDFIPCNTTSNAITVTLPNAPADKTIIAAKLVILGAGNLVTINTSGSDTFNKVGGGTSSTLTLVNQGIYLQYQSSTKIWYVISDDLPLGSLLNYFSGDFTVASTGVATLATVNSNVGTFGNASNVAQIAVNAKGLITSVSNVSILTNTLDTFAAPAANVSFATFGITNLANPINPQDAATKYYVDGAINGLQIKQTATVATTTTLPSYTYATNVITMTSIGVVTIDGHALVLNDVVLVKNETSTNQPYNGLYYVSQAGTASVVLKLTRAADMTTANEFSGAFVPVGNIGAVNANSLWLCNPTTPVVVGTTNIPFTQLNGATDLIQGTGISISGNTISLAVPVLVSNGGTGNTSLITAPTASTIGSWDANLNFSANNFNEGWQTIVTSGGTYVATIGTPKQTFFTGTQNHTVTLPATSTLVTGYSLLFDNNAVGGVITVNSSGGNLVTTIQPLCTAILTCQGTTHTTAVDWNVISATTVPVISVSNSDNTLTISPNTGAVVASINKANQNAWTSGQAGTPFALTDAATIPVSFANGNNFTDVLLGNRTLGVPTSVQAGLSGVFAITQDGTGSRTLAYSWCYLFSGGTVPTLSTGKYITDVLPYIVLYYSSSASITASSTTFTWTAHGMTSGQVMQFTAGTTTTPALNTSYWVNVLTANTFNLSTSLANLQGGTYITASGVSGNLTGLSLGILISAVLNIQQ